MGSIIKREEEARLARECLSGSEDAWRKLYGQYAVLVRTVVSEHRQRWRATFPDTEDVAQHVFTNLMSALDDYDGEHALSSFIAGVAKRTARDVFRHERAAKRSGPRNPVGAHDSGEGGAETVPAEDARQDDLLEIEQLKDIVRKGLWMLKEECRRLLTLRDFQGLSFKEITERTGEKENTLTVRRKRCLDDLRAHCHELIQKGCTA